MSASPSIDFKMDLNNINNTDESIAFNMKVDDENNVAAVNFREKIYERTKEFLPDYVKSKPKNKVVKPKVTYEVIDGVEVEIHNYEKSRRIVKERPKHYNRQQPTYQQIKDYIMEKYNVKIHTVYIAEVKRMHGIDMQANRRKTGTKYGCPKDKVSMIEEALIHFNILTER